MADGAGPLTNLVEALIFASSEPVTETRIRSCLEAEDELNVQTEVDSLNEFYEKHGRSFKIISVAGGYQMVTKPDYEKWVRKLFVQHGRLRLSHAALETLSIIAYRQPVSRPIMESIRGINSDGVVKTLLERNLITIKGREKAPGRPILYGTTTEFLRYFGLGSLKDLPELKEIEEIMSSG